jgi:hypothetical protein
MIMMRKSLTIFCVLALSLFMVGYAFGENNANAYFKLDKNIATAGYQDDTASVSGIAANANVSCAVYAQACDNLKGFTVKLEWDSAKASLRSSATGPNITIEETSTVNGVSIDSASETNMLGSSLIKAGETSGTGTYEVSYALTGTDPVTTPAGLLFYAAFKTASTFTTTTILTVKVSMTIADGNTVLKDLGYRFFNVGPVAVTPQSWGKVKSQFKDF